MPQDLLSVVMLRLELIYSSIDLWSSYLPKITIVTIKNRRRGESKPGFIWRTTAKVCVKIRPIRRFRELWAGIQAKTIC